MNSSAPYTEIAVSNKVMVSIYDHSRVYFGDYYLVRLEVCCAFPGQNLAGQTDPLAYRRFLEKMAVPSAAVEETKLALVAEFSRTSLPYLADPDFQAKYVARAAAGQGAVKKHYTTGS